MASPRQSATYHEMSQISPLDLENIKPYQFSVLKASYVSAVGWTVPLFSWVLMWLHTAWSCEPSTTEQKKSRKPARARNTVRQTIILFLARN